MTTITARPETLRIVASNGGTLNLIMEAPNELQSDPWYARAEKRRLYAVAKMQQWYSNYFNYAAPEETLRIVECDAQGVPVNA